MENTEYPDVADQLTDSPAEEPVENAAEQAAQAEQAESEPVEPATEAPTLDGASGEVAPSETAPAQPDAGDAGEDAVPAVGSVLTLDEVLAADDLAAVLTEDPATENSETENAASGADAAPAEDAATTDSPEPVADSPEPAAAESATASVAQEASADDAGSELEGEPTATEPAPKTAPAADDAAPEADGSTFTSLGLSERTLPQLSKLGFVEPTPIQEAAIPKLLSGRDVVGIAQTGTGKTAAFGLPMIEILDPAEKAVQSLVLAPTRELALQIADAIEQFAAGSGLHVVAVYGGSSYVPQLRALKQGAQIVVGTPGRIMDLIDKGALRLGDVRMLVLDEADEMLRMGFAEDVETIASKTPSERLTALFSATMPPMIARVADAHLREPVRLAVSTESSTVDTIRQTYAVVPVRFRFEALTRVLALRNDSATLVFVRTRQEAEEVSLDLAAQGFRAAGISGDVAQADRERLVQRLRAGTLDVLVATDVAARGLDVERIGLVVNYDVPREREAYVHRIGRTGRAGRDGESLTFFSPKEQYRLRQIERLTGQRMEEVKIPSRESVIGDVAARTLANLPELSPGGATTVLEAALDRAVEQGFDVYFLALRLLAAQTGDAGGKPTKGARNFHETDDSGYFVGSGFESNKTNKRGTKQPNGRGPARERTATKRRDVGTPYDHHYRVEVGRRDGVSPGAIVGAITGEGGVTGDKVGHINIFPSFTLVELREPLSPHQEKKIGRATVRGRRLRIASDKGGKPSARGGRSRA